MRTNIFTGPGILVFFLFLLCGMAAHSQSIVSREYFSVHADFTDVEIDMQDDRYANLLSGSGINFRDKESYGLVVVGFDPNMDICHDVALRYKIRIKSEETVVVTPGSPSVQTNYYDLIVNHDPLLRVSEREQAFIKIPNARRLQLSIVEVKQIGSTGSETAIATPNLMGADVYIEGEIYRERYDNFNPTSVPGYSTLTGSEMNLYLNQHNVHVVEWQNVFGAAEYELEWTYVNSYSPSNLSVPLPLIDINVIFKNNASSVRIPRKSVNRFYIPAIYGKGYVVYRVRAVGRGGAGLDEDVFGDWTLNNPVYNMATLDASHSSSFRPSGLNNGNTNPAVSFNNINSQYSVQFAEEGKLMASGTFADGSMRVRQNVAAVKIHEDQSYGKMSVITETIYDHLGRAAITTLPSVTKDGLRYTPQYSKDASGNKYGYLNFDTDAHLADTTCVTGAEPMKNTSGASLYYSLNNPHKTNGHQGLIAEAHEYPFIHNIFERDNTGRPKMQSGVGIDHKIGSGHETKYIYGGAEQSQLNRLFGTDAGYAAYYQKNMVQDANGQISITYTDMAGRTVATALAGEVPVNVGALVDSSGNVLAEKSDTVTDDMLVISDAFPNGSSNILSDDGMSYTFGSTILIDKRQEYLFSYTAQLADFTDTCFAETFCLDCIYDFEFSLTDECGNYLIGNAQLDDPLKMVLGGTSTDWVCGDTNGVSLGEMILTLDPGKYRVYKKLSINVDSMETYVDAMLKNSLCLADPNVFYEAPDLSGCNITCEQCMSQLGTWDDFFTQEKIDSSFGGDSLLAEHVLRQAYTAMKIECEGLCEDRSRDYCEGIYHLMLMDMSYGGQYARYDEDSLSYFPVSIFNGANKLPLKNAAQFSEPLPPGISGSVPSWRRPILFVPGGSPAFVPGYYNALGERIRVPVELDEDDIYSPRVVDTSLVFPLDTLTNSYYTYPENLLTLGDFMDRWESSMGRSLVFYHPEFLQYDYCVSVYPHTATIAGEEVNGFEFDGLLADMNFAAAASLLGLTSGATLNDLFDAVTGLDPYFSQHPLSGCGTSSFTYLPNFPEVTPCSLLRNKFSNFQTLEVVRNIAQMAYIQNTCGYTYPAGCGTLPPQTWGGLIHDDLTWQTFVQYYISAKQQILIQAMNLYAYYGDTPNNVLTWNGVSTSCIGNDNAFPSYDWNAVQTIQENPCTFPYYVYYQQKEKRFANTVSQVAGAFGLSDPPTADEWTQLALQGTYKETGKCPMAFEVEFLLAKLAMDGNLTVPSVNLNQGGYMGVGIYGRVSGDLSNDTVTVRYQPSVSGNVLSATLGLGCDALEITLPSAAVSAGYTYADIQTFFGLRDILDAGTYHTFEISAIFLNPLISSVPETLAVSGKTCFALTGCEADFRKVCRPTREAEDLMRLLSALSVKGDLFSATPVQLYPDYGPLLTQHLGLYIGDDNDYTWQYVSGTGEFRLVNGVSGAELILDLSHMGLNPADKYEFVSVSGITGTTTTNATFPEFVYRAVKLPSGANHHPYPTADPGAVYDTLKGTIQTVNIGHSFPVTRCEELKPAHCNTKEHKNLDEARNILEMAMAGIGLEGDFWDSCLVIVYVSDSLLLDLEEADEIVSFSADMSYSVNGVNTDYVKAVVRMESGAFLTLGIKSCKPMRNCETCEDEAPCQGVFVKVGPLSSIPFHDNYTLDFDTTYGSYLDCSRNPIPFKYNTFEPAEVFWGGWAQEINALGGAVTASVSGDYLILHIDTAGTPKCNCSNDYYTLSGGGYFIGRYPVQCCGSEELFCSEETIMDFESFPDGWFANQETFSHISWDAKTSNSIMYEQDDMLILENKCLAVIGTDAMEWDMDALYRISCQFKFFNTPDIVNDVSLSFHDGASGTWLEALNIHSEEPRVFYYSPYQSDMRLYIQTQNVDWDIPGGVCVGESKVGLKYLRIEKIPAPYHMAYHPTDGYGITPELILASGGEIDGIEILDDHDDIGIYTSGEVSGDKIILSSRCGAGMSYEFETCPGYEHEFEITVGVPDSAYAPTHVYVLIFAENGGDYVGVFGPYLPGTIRETFTPDADLVSIATVAVNAHTEPDFMDILGGMGSFDEYCGDSVRFTIENYILSKGCRAEYACGPGNNPLPCSDTVYAVTGFPSGWVVTQSDWNFNGDSGSSVSESGGTLNFVNDCTNGMDRWINGTIPGAVYRLRLETDILPPYPYPRVRLDIGDAFEDGIYGEYVLPVGTNEIYFTPSTPDWRITLSGGDYYWDDNDDRICVGTTGFSLVSMTVEKMGQYHVQQTYYENEGIDSTGLANHSGSLQALGIYPEHGIGYTDLAIEDGKIRVKAPCFSGLYSRMETCPGYTLSGTLEIEAPDTAKAPTHIYVGGVHGDGYVEINGPYLPGTIHYTLTPSSYGIHLYVIAVRSDSSYIPLLESIYEDEDLDPYCNTDSVAYYIKSNIITRGCRPAYVCGPYIDSTGWAPADSLVFSQSCNPTILPFPQPDTTGYVDPCVQYLLETAQANADYRYRQYLEEKRAEYRQLYIEKCMNPVRETFDRTYTDGQYHYTLYYYDRAGNLTKTVPPHAVEPLTGGDLSAVNDARDNNTVMVPKHNRTAENSFALTTRYRYNSLNQPIKQQTPDGGTSSFYYDRLGRVSVSQNAVQQTSGRHSYTLYDPLGRITEVGEFWAGTATRSGIYDPVIQEIFFSAATGHAEVTRTFYDAPATGITFDAGFAQHNLRSRVSHTLARPLGETDFVFGTYYDYDIHGNVKALIHRNEYVPSPSLEQNLVEYDYDLVAGTVKKVGYNRHRADKYFHKYAYDDQNRLTHAYTSRNDIKYDLDAKYFYYRHGPLARTELGQNRVQGLDYAYTIHGWLKSVNSDALSESVDPGQDGHVVLGNPNANFARDAYGFSLHYYAGDYTPILSSYAQTKTLPGAYNAVSLFNGNISAMNNTLRKPDGHTVHPLLQRFGYDQLNRIAESVAFGDYDFTGNQWNAATPHMQEYATSYTYDPAGNLLTLNRNGDKHDTLEMDSLRYTYHPLTNRLMRVNDVVDAGNYTIDIDDQTGTNYDYDAIGNLVKDEAEEIEEIKWTVYGKVSEVKRYATSTRPDLKFYYDAGGKRIMKKVIPKNGAPEKTEYYVHDAQGNPLTIYSYLASDTPTYKVNEQMLYGSSRLGLWKSEVDLLAHLPEVPEVLLTDRGNKRYELNNHLGNVHAVLSDRRVRVCDEGVFEHYQADIRNTYDYYPFGMMMPGRNHNATVAPPDPCVPDTTVTRVVPMDENFSSSGGWTATGSGTVSYVSSEMQVSNPNAGTNPIGAQKSFTGGTGQHTVSFDLEGNICGQYIVWPPAFNPSSVEVRVKDATNAVIASQTYTASSGSYSFSYTPAAAGTHTLEFYMASGTSLCHFRLDDIKIEYDSVSVTVCDTIPCVDSLRTVFHEPFDTGYGGFTPEGTATFSNTGGALDITVSATSFSKVASRPFTAEAGKYTFVEYSVDSFCQGRPLSSNTAIYIRDTSGNLVISQGVVSTGNKTMFFVPAHSGTYTIEVWGNVILSDTCTISLNDLKVKIIDFCPVSSCRDSLVQEMETFDSGIGGFATELGHVDIKNTSQRLEVEVSGGWVATMVGEDPPLQLYKDISMELGATYRISFDYELEQPCASFFRIVLRDIWGNIMYADTLTSPASGTYSIEVQSYFTGTARLSLTIPQPAQIGGTLFNPIYGPPCSFYIDNFEVLRVKNCAPPQNGNANLLADSYRFGFNGHEKDNEVYGDYNSYTAEYWQYDPRLGRRWNLDPVPQISVSDYACFLNNPIINIDPDGSTVEPSQSMGKEAQNQVFKTIISVTNKSTILNMIYDNMEKAEAKYIIGDKTSSREHATASAYFTTSKRSKFNVWVSGGADYIGYIKINFGKVFNITGNEREVIAAEELFHAGQDLYRRRFGTETVGGDTRLQDEVEARVFRAYSGFIGDGDDPYVKTFASSENKAVTNYFDALRNGDTEKITAFEGAFRDEVKKMAKGITLSGHAYSYLGSKTNEYNERGAQTPFFDALTKEIKAKD